MERYTAGYLRNGVGYLLAPSQGARVCHAALFLRAGPRFESPELSGVTHFLEHLLANPAYFRGELRRVWEKLQDQGARLGAWTAKEYLMVQLLVPSDAVPDAFKFLRLVIEPARLRKKDVETERKVILEEIARRRYTPQQAFLVVEEALFRGGYGMPVLGKAETVERMSLDDIKGWARQVVSADSLRLVISGEIPDGVTTALEIFSELKAGNPPNGDEGVEIAPRFVLIPGETPRVRLLFAFPGPGYAQDERPASEVLAYLMGGDFGSPVFENLRQSRGLAYEAFGSSMHYKDVGLFFFNAELSRENLQKGFGVLMETIRGIHRSSIAEKVLQRAKSALALSTFRHADPAQLLGKLGMRWLNDGLYFPSQEAKRYQKVKLDEVQAVAKRYLNPEAMAMVAVGVSSEELSQMMEVLG